MIMATRVWPMVRGRERESAQLHEVVAAARTGRVEVLVLAGEAGIGKTTLLDTAAHATEGMQVLRTTGMPTETQIGFVGLVDLLTPVLEHRTRLPASQRRAIERALALGRSSSWPAGDGRLTLRVATLALLAAAADEAATLVVVDDAQWVDQESLDTLAFAARRLAVDRIGFLFAVRMPAGAPPEAGPPVPGLAGFPVLRLAGLDYETSDALLTAAAPQLTERVVRDAVLATAAGNPLALQEIPGYSAPTHWPARYSPVRSQSGTRSGRPSARHSPNWGTVHGRRWSSRRPPRNRAGRTSAPHWKSSDCLFTTSNRPTKPA